MHKIINNIIIKRLKHNQVMKLLNRWIFLSDKFSSFCLSCYYLNLDNAKQSGLKTLEKEMVEMLDSGTVVEEEAQETLMVGDCWTVEGNEMTWEVWYHYVEFPCVFLGLLFSEKILHIIRKRTVCILCVFLCELSGCCSDWMLYHKQCTYVAFLLK